MTSLAQSACAQAERGVRALEALQPKAQLAARLYVAKVFLLSGLTKVRDWETTIALFSDDIAAIGLLVLNAVAVLSLGNVAEAALQQHVFWGSLLIGLALWGPGRWSLDAWWPVARTRTRVLTA
jgi:putative oxidoreductase